MPDRVAVASIDPISHSEYMSTDGQDDAQDRLLRMYRCVAFAALDAGVSEPELRDALQVAVDADTARSRMSQVAAPRQRHLKLATPADSPQ